MDPISGLVLTVILLVINLIVSIITYPFEKIKEFTYNHPKKATISVITIFAGLFIAGLFDADLKFNISFSDILDFIIYLSEEYL